MNDKVLNIVIKAKDEATKTLEGLSNTLKKNEKSFKNMALAGTVAVGAVTGVIVSSINSYKESERAQRQLEHAIVSVSKGTKQQVEEVNKLTMALEKKAGIDGDALNAGVAQLSTFGLQSKSVVALTKSLADLTVNQNGVTAGADQYISSANIMAKALNGQFGLLEKMGIRFTETQQEMIKFGTESQKVATIQEGLAQNLRETTDTVDGYDVKLGQLRHTIGNIQDQIGKALQPILLKMADTLLPIIQKIGDWIEKNPQLATGILLAVGALGLLSVVLGTIGLVLPTVLAGLAMLSPVVLPLIGIIGGFTWTIHNLNESIKILQTDSEMVLLGLKAYWNDFVTFVKKLIGGFIDDQKAKWELLKTIVKSASEGLVSFFQPFVDTVISAYNWVVNLINKMKELSGGGLVGAVANFFGRGKATGGGVQTGQSYMVGERGPEMFTPSTNGSITPNYKLAGNGGGQTVVINMNGGTYLDENVAEKIGDMIINNFRRTVKF